MRIVWDDRKRLANLDKHGMDFASLDLGFFMRAMVVPAKRARFVAIANLDVPTTVVFSLLGSEAISIVSMRPDSREERKLL